MNIETYGTGERIRTAARLSATLPIEHLVILPVPTTKDKITVAGTDIPLSDTLANVGRGSLVFGYGLFREYKESVEALGGACVDLSLDEAFLSENAYVTAIGAISYILKSEKRIPRDLSFGIVGYGRIGSRLVNMLLFFGARVRVYTGKMLTRLRLGECGIDSVCIGEGSFDLSGIDVLINTAPRDMRGAFCDGKIPDKMRVLELASGDNFSGVEGVEYLAALPEVMYPESAGRIYYEAIKEYIGEKI